MKLPSRGQSFIESSELRVKTETIGSGIEFLPVLAEGFGV